MEGTDEIWRMVEKSIFFEILDKTHFLDSCHLRSGIDKRFVIKEKAG